MRQTWTRILVVGFAAGAMTLVAGQDVRAAWFDWAYPPRTVQGVSYAAAPTLAGCSSCASAPAAVLPVTSQYRAATAYAAYYPSVPVVAYRPAAVVAYSPVSCGSCAPAPVVAYRPVFGWARPLGYSAYATYRVAYLPSCAGCASCAAIPACDPCASSAPALGCATGCTSCAPAPAATTTFYAPSSDYYTPPASGATTSPAAPTTRIESPSSSAGSPGDGAVSSSGSSIYGAEPTPKTFVPPSTPSGGAASGPVGGDAQNSGGGTSDSGAAGEHSTLGPIPESGSFLNSTPAAPKLIDPKDRTTSRDMGRTLAERPLYQPVARATGAAGGAALPPQATSAWTKPPLDNSGWRASRD